MNINLSVPVLSVQQIVKGLGRLPYDDVRQIISDIVAQTNRQIDDSQAAVAHRPEPGKTPEPTQA